MNTTDLFLGLIAGAIAAYVIIKLSSRPITNTETFEWEDYKGNIRKMTIHREIEENNKNEFRTAAI